MAVTRLIAETDAAALADILQRNREAMASIEPRRPPAYFTTKGQRALIRDALQRHAQGASFPRVILDGEEVVGRVTINEILLGPSRRGALGYYLDVRAQGRGLATMAVEEIVGLAFGRLDLHRIEAATRLDNEASQRVLERTGFHRVGIVHDYLRVGGDWQDHVLFERIAGR